eukprot:GHVU01128610.1.p2 GENE.GHVU01128610.1~~GHVU01128610.1.p2  ORF type:complete len:120 (+),score=14.06 GHVU01128610.1:3-362(+)
MRVRARMWWCVWVCVCVCVRIRMDGPWCGGLWWLRANRERRSLLTKCAATSLSSKLIAEQKDYFAKVSESGVGGLCMRARVCACVCVCCPSWSPAPLGERANTTAAAPLPSTVHTALLS